MTVLFGIDIKALIGQATAGQLVDGTLIRLTKGLRDPDNLTSGSLPEDEEFAFEGIVADYTDQQMASTTIQLGDRQVLIIAATISGTVPMTGDRITIEGSTYDVVNVKRDPAEATYECQVRK